MIHIKAVSLLLLLFTCFTSLGQGRVVINEYMPWTLNGCGSTSEFVELMNFGPGPVDIGCYILTDGDYAVTIPANTILLPGEFYVIAGRDIINAPCANIDSTIHADLNWNTCGCTSDPIPADGDGFFTDGGSANEQLVLLDPSLNVLDAVVRNYPVETSSLITTSGLSGCAAQSFDLDDMQINYETLGMSTGRGNSFARKLDGDCGWVKDPQQSANATNNTPGDVSDVTYVFSYISSMACGTTGGSIHISVKRASLDGFFPMKWTLAFDSDNDGQFYFDDQYTYGADSTPPDIIIANLPVGRYRITVESAQGCSLKSFDFQIIPCMPALPVQLINFTYRGARDGKHQLEWKIANAGELDHLVLEKSTQNGRFITGAIFQPQVTSSGISLTSAFAEPDHSGFTFFRLKIVGKDGSYFYSPVITIQAGSSFYQYKVWPNPASDHLNVQIQVATSQKLHYSIINMNGVTVRTGEIFLNTGTNSFSISLKGLPPSAYQLRTSDGRILSFNFVKS